MRSRIHNDHVREMQSVRSRNNDLWMEILDIALYYAEDETKAIIREIRKNDMAVADLFDEIAGC